jgi:hypothetical protein
MKKSIYKNVLRAAAPLAVLLILSQAMPADSHNSEVRLRARLAGSAIGGVNPEGNADFRSDARGRTRLNVEVEHVNLPQGTVLSVSLTHGGTSTVIGHTTLNALGFGELELNSQDGDSVPAVQTGDVVTVMNGGAAVLAGVF